MLYAPDYSLHDIYSLLQGSKFAGTALYPEVLRYDARTLGPKFDVPFFIFNGAEDSVTPIDHARRYFDFVRAPHKEFVSFPNAGHSAVLTMPDAFLHELVARVRPIAIENETGALHG